MPFLNGILWPFFKFVENNRWAQIVLGLGIGWLIIMIYLWVRDSGVRKQARLQWEAQSAKERERVIETSNKEISDVQDAKDAALAAPDRVPEYPSADVLREQAPTIGRVILTDRPKNQPGS